MAKAKCERLQAKLNGHSNNELVQQACAQRTEQVRVMGKLDTVTSKIIQLRRKLVDLCQQIPDTDVGASSAKRAQTYHPCNIGPKKLLIGDDIGAYTPWEHKVKEKLHTNAIIYKNDRDQVNYVLQQII